MRPITVMLYDGQGRNYNKQVIMAGTYGDEQENEYKWASGECGVKDAARWHEGGR